MFAELVPGKYDYYINGDVRMHSLPLYQCGGSFSGRERTFIPKDRDLTKDEIVALEMIAHHFRDEGVSTKMKKGKVHGLRLNIKHTRELITNYKTIDDVEQPLLIKDDQEKKYVVSFRSDNTHFILSKSDIENKIAIDSDFINKIDIFELGGKVRPKVRTMITL
jgi:hypothetical protein